MAGAGFGLIACFGVPAEGKYMGLVCGLCPSEREALAWKLRNLRVWGKGLVSGRFSLLCHGPTSPSALAGTSEPALVASGIGA